FLGRRPIAAPAVPADLVGGELRPGGNPRDAAYAKVVAGNGGSHAVVPHGDGGHMAAVPVGVPGGEKLPLTQLDGTEALDEVAGADELVVAGAGREALAGLAGPPPPSRGRRRGGLVGEARMLGVDAGVDDADDDPLAG